MRYATLRTPDGTAAAVLDSKEWLLLAAADVAQLLRNGGADPTGERIAVADADHAPVVTSPRKVICVGLNYARHVREVGRELPAYPTLFSKFDDALIGARDDVVIPSVSDKVDWEAELGVVIGRNASRVSRRDALGVVAGYTVINDVSMRDWQGRTTQWLQGKSFDRSTPVGPTLVTPDELPEACSGLRIECRVDDEVMQSDVIGDFIFDIPTIIEYVTAFTTLRPGDVIATGTPDGVGLGRDPQVFLRPGQVMTTTVEGVGQLSNRIMAEGDQS